MIGKLGLLLHPSKLPFPHDVRVTGDLTKWFEGRGQDEELNNDEPAMKIQRIKP